MNISNILKKILHAGEGYRIALGSKPMAALYNIMIATGADTPEQALGRAIEATLFLINQEQRGNYIALLTKEGIVQPLQVTSEPVEMSDFSSLLLYGKRGIS